MNELKVNIIRYPKEEDWLLVKNNALITLGKRSENFPDNEWKMKILISEHSPIRALLYVWEWVNLPYWIAMHFRTHKVGIEHFIKTQRNDKQSNYDRNKASQSMPVIHRCIANAQAILNISQKRLCNKTSLETKSAWYSFLKELSPFSKELVLLCAPTCIHRNGICPEFESCGYNKTQAYRMEQESYLQLIKGENKP